MCRNVLRVGVGLDIALAGLNCVVKYPQSGLAGRKNPDSRLAGLSWEMYYRGMAGLNCVMEYTLSGLADRNI
jgi:hypothetical protein